MSWEHSFRKKGNKQLEGEGREGREEISRGGKREDKRGLRGSLSSLGLWLWSQRLGVQFPTVPPVSRGSLCGLGQAAQSQDAPRRKEG